MYSVSIINPYEEQRTITFRDQEYDSLMQMIFHALSEDIGDCKGRAWCGTCHVLPESGTVNEFKTVDEIKTLSGLTNTTVKSRLACQIMADEKIDGMIFRMLT